MEELSSSVHDGACTRCPVSKYLRTQSLDGFGMCSTDPWRFPAAVAQSLESRPPGTTAHTPNPAAQTYIAGSTLSRWVHLCPLAIALVLPTPPLLPAAMGEPAWVDVLRNLHTASIHSPRHLPRTAAPRVFSSPTPLRFPAASTYPANWETALQQNAQQAQWFQLY